MLMRLWSSSVSDYASSLCKLERTDVYELWGEFGFPPDKVGCKNRNVNIKSIRGGEQRAHARSGGLL